jgi:F0F1-type ATP synthase epsilon subunit
MLTGTASGARFALASPPLIFLELISPQRVVYEGRVRSVCLSLLGGSLNVECGGHIGRREFGPGLITAVEDLGAMLEFPTAGGLAEIEEDRVTILVR